MVSPGGNDRLVVGMVQINGMSLTKHAAGATAFSFLPYSVGLLEAYARREWRDTLALEFLPPVYQRLPVQQAVDQLLDAHVVGFSTYVWNINLSLQIAQRLKELRPETLIILGGPQVPDRAESFLRRHPYVDVTCHGEGERVFSQLLSRARQRDWTDIPSISFLHADGRFETHAKAERIADLDILPSPYLEGTFDKLMALHPNDQWFPLWETNRGCPFKCTFCDWGSAIAGRVYRFDMERLQGEMEWFASRQVHFVYCCDANFGMLPRDLEIARMLVETKQKTGYPWWISVQNTKNATERSYTVNKMLSDAGMHSRTGVTIALQSVNQRTLEAIKRDNISTESFRDLEQRFHRDGIETYTDLIVGLPDEDYPTFAEGVAQTIAQGQHNRLQFYNCSILPNAEMGDPEYQARYGMETVPVRMIEAHTPLDAVDDEVFEFLETCVATRAMPRPDWLRAKVYSWMTEFLHFERVAQIPFVLLHEQYGIGYREMIEACIRQDPRGYPILSGLHEILHEQAVRAQAGGCEFFPSERWLGIYWPADQWALLQIVTRNQVVHFYVELERALTEMLSARGSAYDPVVLHQAVHLNMCLLKVPMRPRDLEIELSHNIWQSYQSALVGGSTTLQEGSWRYRIERAREVWLSPEHWCADLVERQNRKSSFLYGISALTQAPAMGEPVLGS